MVGEGLGRIAGKCLQERHVLVGWQPAGYPPGQDQKHCMWWWQSFSMVGKLKASEIFSFCGVSSLVLQMYQPIWGDPEKSQKKILACLVSRHGASSPPQLQASCPKPARLPHLDVSAPESLLRYSRDLWKEQLPASQRLEHHLCRVFSGGTQSVSQAFTHCMGPTALQCWR